MYLNLLICKAYDYDYILRIYNCLNKLSIINTSSPYSPLSFQARNVQSSVHDNLPSMFGADPSLLLHAGHEPGHRRPRSTHPTATSSDVLQSGRGPLPWR